MGPYYFAWCDPDELTFGAEHLRFDEDVLSFTIQHDEGDFPSLDITIINPRVGFLAPGRKVWAWLAYDRNWGESDAEPDVRPLFFGRLVGVPEDLQAEEVRLAFVARPENYAEQKAAVADALKVRPYWDGIWFSPETRDDPDNALEARPELWHVDRLTLDVTSSNILNGEDGVIELGEGDVFYDSVRLSYGQPPLRRVEVNASVSWEQNATGLIDVSDKLSFGSGHSILTFTGDGLVDKWPKSGARIGGGWYVSEASAARADGLGLAVWGYGLRNTKGAAGGASANPFGRSYIASEDFHDVICPSWAVASSFGGSGAGGFSASFPARTFGVPRWRVVPVLRVSYDVSRKRSEQLSFTLEADVQSVITEPGDEEALQLSFRSSEIAAPVDPVEGGSESDGEPLLLLPIRDVRSSVYFSTARGTQSVEYLISLARSRLLARARCVEVEMEIGFNAGVDFELSCRKSVLFHDSRMPGGLAAGKIKSYTLSGDGSSGVQACSISIGCSVGHGGTVEAVEGEPTYCEAEYVDSGYQVYAGAFVMPIPGEVVYGSIEGLPANDDGIDFFRMTAERCVLSVEKSGSYTEQAAAMGASAEEPNEIYQRLNAVPTTFTLNMRPVTGGPFETVFAVPTSVLTVPKTIDLEASS